MARGLYAGTSGNVSARTADGLLITPTGVPCDDVDAASIVAMTADGARARPAGAVERMAHPPRHLPAASRGRRGRAHALDRSRPRCRACAGRSPRSTTWSRRRAATTSAARGTRPTERRRCRATRSPRWRAGGAPACSPTTACSRWAPTSRRRALLAEEIEALCAQYIARARRRPPVILPAREMKRVRAKFATYGATSAARPAAR